MSKNHFTLDNESFWGWLSDLEHDSAETQYLSRIRKNQIESSYMPDLIEGHLDDRQSAEIFDKLSLYMPRQYFLEVDYCAKTYAAIFSKVFPPLMARVGELAYMEWFLYTEPDNMRYRDHLVHMFKVAYAGDRLLSKLDELKRSIISCQFMCDHFTQWCSNRKLDVSLFEDGDKEEIIKLAFFFAALFHDFGYGYYFLRRYEERLFRLYEWMFPASDLADTASLRVQTLLQSLACQFVKDNHAWLESVDKENKAYNSLQKSVVSGFLHDCLPLNHSVASAFFIIDLAEKLWVAKTINDKLYIALHLAAEAAMIHDMTKEGNWAHLKQGQHAHFLNPDCHNHVPIAMLLILVDELSAWNRYRLKAEWENDKVIYSMDQNNVPKQIDIAISNNKVVVKPLHDQSHDIAKDPILNAFTDLVFLKKRKRDRHLNMMGYKIYVEPKHL